MGKNKYIETPEKFLEHFENYKKHNSNNPRFKNELDKFGNIVSIPLRVPLTIEGFENWCSKEGIIEDLSQYFANTEQRYTNYQTICTRVRKEVRQDQIEGGLVGQYNASITQRLNGLVEKQETEIKGSLNIPNIPDIGNR